MEASCSPAVPGRSSRPSRRYRFKRKATALCNVFSRYGLQPLPLMHQLTIRQLQRPGRPGELRFRCFGCERLGGRGSPGSSCNPFWQKRPVLEEGKCIYGKLKEGAAGFCMVYFPDEEPFKSQVPNLWLSSCKSTPAFKRGKALGKAKKKAKRASEPAGKEAEAAVESSKSGKSNQKLLPGASEAGVLEWLPFSWHAAEGVAACQICTPTPSRLRLRALV